MEEAPHIVLVPSPGMGHLIPLAELAKLLVARFGFSASLLLPTLGNGPTLSQTTFLNSLPPSISHTFLPRANPDPAHLPVEVAINVANAGSLPFLRTAMSSLLAQQAQVVALITDLFGTMFFDVARELGIPPYMYFTSNAMCLLFFLSLPGLDEKYVDMPDPLVLPRCMPLWGRDLVDPWMDRRSESYRDMIYALKRFALAEGIFINTFYDLEPGAIRGLQTEDPNWPPVYPIGPMIQSGQTKEANGSRPECLKWLDRQPPGSVLFVSFGSGGTLSKEQFDELAFGLEKSGHRFLWVVRSPNISHDNSSSSFFTAQTQDDPFGFLRDGYLDRVKGRGLLVPSWAPQIQVLKHRSTGGFLTHCGWNSTLESMINGVPLIAWPLYSEQSMNAILLSEGLKVALRPYQNELGLNEANEIARVVKELMEGEVGKETRHRMKEFSDLAKKAISENGSSTKSLAEIAHQWSHSKVVPQED